VEPGVSDKDRVGGDGDGAGDGENEAAEAAGKNDRRASTEEIEEVAITNETGNQSIDQSINQSTREAIKSLNKKFD